MLAYQSYVESLVKEEEQQQQRSRRDDQKSHRATLCDHLRFNLPHAGSTALHHHADYVKDTLLHH